MRSIAQGGVDHAGRNITVGGLVVDDLALSHHSVDVERHVGARVVGTDGVVDAAGGLCAVTVEVLGEPTRGESLCGLRAEHSQRGCRRRSGRAVLAGVGVIVVESFQSGLVENERHNAPPCSDVSRQVHNEVVVVGGTRTRTPQTHVVLAAIVTGLQQYCVRPGVLPGQH